MSVMAKPPSALALTNTHTPVRTFSTKNTTLNHVITYSREEHDKIAGFALRANQNISSRCYNCLNYAFCMHDAIACMKS